MSQENKIPVICLAPSSVNAFDIFNPNNWMGKSKSIVQSCSTELSILHYEAINIVKICNSPEKYCQPRFEDLKRSISNPKDLLDKTIIYAQVPEMHVLVKAFFSSLKGLIDLIVQLLSSEKIVKNELDGFHRKKDIYGGSVLNALSNNASKNKKKVAKDVANLIENNKTKWLDNVIQARNLLVHPSEGFHQLMFEMELGYDAKGVTLEKVIPPHIGNQEIDKYATEQVMFIEEFCRSFLAKIGCESPT